MVNHPNRKYVAPSLTLADKCREAGADVRLMWEQRGPRGTSIEWLSAYLINGTMCIVQTFTGDNGWEAYTPCQSIQIDDTVADVLARCAPQRKG
jgi:hypothetical protein